MSFLQMPGRSAAVAALLAATYVLTHVTITPAVSTSAPSLASLPMQLSEWSGVTAPPLAPGVAETLAANEYVRRYYQGPRGVLEMDVAYYAQPRVGTTMHSPLNCLPGSGWEIASVETRPITTMAGTWGVRELTVERGTDKYALTYWFQSRNRIVADELSARVHLLGDALWRRPTDTGLVRVMMPVSGAASEERATIAEFATRLIPEIAARLQ
jgi:EpsI family protein